ncbi:MAG: hypothetical protein FRX49_08940 [Trebouxia sp. A1-2]|nr:MAG: hypothetical protein FRX49_08940 [Trebouxia sp. A1-2]
MEGPGRLRRPGVWVALAPLSLKRMMKGTLSIPPFNHWPEGRHAGGPLLLVPERPCPGPSLLDSTTPLFLEGSRPTLIGIWGPGTNPPIGDGHEVGSTAGLTGIKPAPPLPPPPVSPRGEAGAMAGAAPSSPAVERALTGLQMMRTSDSATIAHCSVFIDVAATTATAATTAIAATTATAATAAIAVTTATAYDTTAQHSCTQLQGF